MQARCSQLLFPILALSLLSLPGVAKTWSGALVDSKCYAYEEANVNPTDTMTSVDRDTGREVRYCSPSTKTKSFALVQEFGPTLTLDSAGNAKALDLVRNTAKKSILVVVVQGEMNKSTISVDSIAMATREKLSNPAAKGTDAGRETER